MVWAPSAGAGGLFGQLQAETGVAVRVCSKLCMGPWLDWANSQPPTSPTPAIMHVPFSRLRLNRAHWGLNCCRCISWGPDPEGVNGVFLGKDVPLQVRRVAHGVVCIS